MLKRITQPKLARKREPYGLCAKPTPKKAILHAPLTKKGVRSGCHTLLTCNVTQNGTEGVATQGPCGEVGCERLDSITTILTKRTGDTPHLGGDPLPTPTHTSGDTETLDYDAEALWPSGVAFSVDEIDNDKTDTFAPFLRDKTCRDVPPNGPDDFLSKIHFEGDESFQNELRTLCSEYADIFSDKLAPQAAALKPFEINLPKQRWVVPSNRTPVRPQSSKKEDYLRTSIEEMLEDAMIERADAAYYSHPVMVNKSADTYRTCIDYRPLIECIELAYFPLPNIKHFFERIGNKKPDTFGVMDLIAGYHQAPLYPPHRIYTAFACFMGCSN